MLKNRKESQKTWEVEKAVKRAKIVKNAEG